MGKQAAKVRTASKAVAIKAKMVKKQQPLAKKGGAKKSSFKLHTTSEPAKEKKQATVVQEMDVDNFLTGDHLTAKKKQAKKQVKVAASPEKAVSGSHKSELDALKASDPEFYKYLEENDQSLLNFEELGDDDEEEEEDEEQEDEDEEEEAPADDDDEEMVEEEEEEEEEEEFAEEFAGSGGKRVMVLSRQKFDAMTAGMGAKGSYRAMKRIVILLRCACSDDVKAPEASTKEQKKLAKKNREDDDEEEGEEADEESDDEDEEEEEPVKRVFEILDADLRRDVIDFACVELEERFKGVYDAKKSSHKVESLLMSTLRGLLEALKPGEATLRTATPMQLVIAPHVARFSKWLVLEPFKEKLGSKYVRTLVQIFARTIDGAGDDENAERLLNIQAQQRLQVETYCRLRELIAHEKASPDFDPEEDSSLQELALRKSYTTFARDVGPSLQKQAYAKRRAPSVAFVGSCVTELYAEAPAGIAYRSAFVYVRQLALTVRGALARRDAANVEKVLCWRFLSAARCWTSVLAKDDNASTERLGPLIFPLCQVLFATMELAQSAKHTMVRLHCVAALHTVAAAAESYVPTTPALLATLEDCKSSRTSVKTSTKLPDDWSLNFTLTIPDDILKLRQTSDEIARYACDCLSDYLEIIRYSPALPELVLIPIVALKQAGREQSASPNFKAGVRATLTLFEAAADDVEKKRDALSVAPKDLKGLEALLTGNAPNARKRLATSQRDRARRRSRLQPTAANQVKAPEKEKKKKKKKKKPKGPKPAAKETEPAHPEGISNFNLDDFLG